LTFQWRVSSEAIFDSVVFSVDNVPKTEISGESGWLGVTNQIALGAHVLKWEYAKDESFFSGADRAWLDQVSFSRLPPAPVTNLTLRVTNDNAQVTFGTQPGYNHIVQRRTNLTTGTWTALTNILGDGTLQTFSFPLEGRPESYFRVASQ
jgi:hypothetical protein